MMVSAEYNVYTTYKSKIDYADMVMDMNSTHKRKMNKIFFDGINFFLHSASNEMGIFFGPNLFGNPPKWLQNTQKKKEQGNTDQQIVTIFYSWQRAVCSV